MGGLVEDSGTSTSFSPVLPAVLCIVLIKLYVERSTEQGGRDVSWQYSDDSKVPFFFRSSSLFSFFFFPFPSGEE